MSNKIKSYLEEFYPREHILVNTHIQWNQLKVCIYNTQDYEHIVEQRVRGIMQKLSIPNHVFLSIYVSKNPQNKYKGKGVGMWGQARRIA